MTYAASFGLPWSRQCLRASVMYRNASLSLTAGRCLSTVRIAAILSSIAVWAGLLSGTRLMSSARATRASPVVRGGLGVPPTDVDLRVLSRETRGDAATTAGLGVGVELVVGACPPSSRLRMLDCVCTVDEEEATTGSSFWAARSSFVALYKTMESAWPLAEGNIGVFPRWELCNAGARSHSLPTFAGSDHNASRSSP